MPRPDTTQMPFDPFKRKAINTRPHVVVPGSRDREAHCVNCGATGLDIFFDIGGCDPISEAAKAFQKQKRDSMVGRITGNSVK